MKAVEITEATLADYGRRARKDTWVLTRNGRPVAAVVPIRSGADLESFGLSHNPRFIEIVNRSWESYRKSGGVSLEEMRRRHGPRRTTARRRKAR
jgi:antitoxin (DNA-binding transcriptional repressor) of toxin-antitoxin stability system